MAIIFLSYASEDRERARPLAAALEMIGWSVWWDRKIPAGRTFAEVIEAALTGSRCVIVLWSHESVKSQWVREEADEGKKRGKLVPVFVDAVEPPMGFRAIHAADLVDWDGTTSAAGFRQLVTDLTALLGAPPKGLDPQGSQPTLKAESTEAKLVTGKARPPVRMRWVVVGAVIVAAALGGWGVIEMQRRAAMKELAREEAVLVAKQKADDERERSAAETARKAAEEEKRRQAEEAARVAAEEQKRRQAGEAARKAAEEQKRRQAEEAARKAAEEERRRLAARTADLCRQGFVWREARPGDHVCVDPKTRDLVQQQNRQRAKLWTTGAYGPHTCVQGYVWREAFPGDDVCVDPRFRDQTRHDNAEAARRVAR